MSYESPISIIESVGDVVANDIAQQKDKYITKQILMQVDVDKAELLKALAYDRRQYEKGYADGKRDAVKHGEWRQQGDFYSCEIGVSVCEAQCSVCGRISSQINPRECVSYAFCPRCGAIMNDEVSE